MGRPLRQLEPAPMQVVTAEQRIAALERQNAELLAQPFGHDHGKLALAKMRWIVGGVLISLFLLMSFAWSSLVMMSDSWERQAARSHELAMGALEVAKTQQSASAIPDNMGLILGLAFCAAIIIGVCARR